MDEALRSKLLELLPYLRHSVKTASKEGVAMIGVLSIGDDGSGRVVSQFHGEEFVEDLATLLNAPPQTEEQDMEATALELAQKFRMS